MTRTLFVSDLDGTLLNTRGEISPTTASLLNDMIDARALLFTVATARTPATVEPLLRDIHDTGLPCVVMGGAALWNRATQSYELKSVIPDDVVNAIADVFERHALRPFVYRELNGILVAHHYGPMSKQEKAFVAQRNHLTLKSFSLDDADYRHSDGEPLLMFSMQDYDRLKPIRDEIEATIHCSMNLYHDIEDPKNGLMEVYRAGTSKASAIQALAQQIGADRIVAFGDNRNDIPMLQAADIAIVPDNAFDDVKRLANEVIENNDSDAVARWLLNNA